MRIFGAALLTALVVVPTLTFAADPPTQEPQIAFVNNRAISKEKLVDLLIDAHGLAALQQLVLLELAKEAAEKAGVTVTAADVQEEYRTSLERITPETGDQEQLLTREDREKVLVKMLDEWRVSMAEFMITMERNAYLRKLVGGEFVVTEATLREEFARTYGAKVRVRHIEVHYRDASRLNEVQDRLKRGDDFATVARELSQNAVTAPLGGEYEPFTFSDEEVPETFRSVAFSLKPGEVSQAVRVGKVFQVIKLEERITDQNVRFEDVRDKVEEKLRERVIPDMMANRLTELFNKARVQVLDRSLRAKYKDFIEEEKRRALEKHILTGE